MANPKAMTVNNILTQMLRLAQITSGFITWDAELDADGNPLSRSVEAFPMNQKLDRLVDLIKENGEGKIFVWATFVFDIRAIAARLELEGIKAVTFYGGTSEADRAEAERQFNFEPSCKVFIGNPAAGGTGLNLLGYPPGDDTATTFCDRVIYYSQNWSMVQRAQSEDRCHRRGTKQQVRITDLCCPNTIDEEIRDRVVLKRARALEITDLRDILSRMVLKVGAE